MHKSSCAIATYPIGALELNKIVPFGSSFALDFSSPNFVILLSPLDIYFESYPDKSFGVIQGISLP